jgi:hypothetical protein
MPAIQLAHETHEAHEREWISDPVARGLRGILSLGVAEDAMVSSLAERQTFEQKTTKATKARRANEAFVTFVTFCSNSVARRRTV